jgi:hypothetical protein
MKRSANGIHLDFVPSDTQSSRKLSANEVVTFWTEYLSISRAVDLKIKEGSVEEGRKEIISLSIDRQPTCFMSPPISFWKPVTHI